MSNPLQVALFAFFDNDDINNSGYIPVQISQDGSLFVSIGDGTSNAEVITPVADNISEETESLATVGFNYGFNGESWDRLLATGNNGDNNTPDTLGVLQTNSFLYGFNGSTFDRIRIANISHTVIATAAGSTAVWTPTEGKKFRLMGYTIDVAGTLAATGVQSIQLQDSATTFKNHLADVIETTAVGDSGSTTNIGADLGQGYLSTLANNVLNIVLSSEMVTGGVAINVWGTEE
jgi:hypothetical protein